MGTTKMTPVNIHAADMKGGEYQADRASPSKGKSTKPAAGSTKGKTFDGPFGGKAPQS